LARGVTRKGDPLTYTKFESREAEKLLKENFQQPDTHSVVKYGPYLVKAPG
jgi:hypothetical protein